MPRCYFGMYAVKIKIKKVNKSRQADQRPPVKTARVRQNKERAWCVSLRVIHHVLFKGYHRWIWYPVFERVRQAEEEGGYPYLLIRSIVPVLYSYSGRHEKIRKKEKINKILWGSEPTVSINRK